MIISRGDYVQCGFKVDCSSANCLNKGCGNGIHWGGSGVVVCTMDAVTHDVEEDSVWVVMGINNPVQYPARLVRLVEKAHMEKVLTPREILFESLKTLKEDSEKISESVIRHFVINALLKYMGDDEIICKISDMYI